MFKYNNITTGADIEVFIQHRQTQEVISAEGLIKGTKSIPFNFDPANKYYGTSLDNVLAEFCIPPARNKEEFYESIQKSLGYINNTIPKDYCTAILQAHSLDSKWLQTEQARVFGCEPDYNAYTNGVNNKPSSDDPNLRSAGGHIHIGYDEPEVYKLDNDVDKALYQADEQRLALIKAIDLHVGVPSVIMEPDNMRKLLYGKAGCFRPKPYGVEYRTVSNFYLQSKELTLWAYEAVMAAVEWLNGGNIVEPYIANYIQRTIDYNDKYAAQELIDTFNLKIA